MPGYETNNIVEFPALVVAFGCGVAFQYMLLITSTLYVRLNMPDKVIPIETVHEYDNPALSPKEFLMAVVHDKTVDLHLRIKAASYALPLYCAQPWPERTAAYTIRVPTLQ
jgi:hypothetical protein